MIDPSPPPPIISGNKRKQAVVNDPILHSRFFRYNGNLQKVYQYIDRQRDPKSAYIPKWCVALSIAGALLILTVLIAALAVIYFAPRPALYQENCERRSCVSGFNLKCLSGKCDCDTGYIYIKKCVEKKTFSEPCRTNNYCKDNKNLVCMDGACKCNTTRYWSGTSCELKGLYNAACTKADQCLTQSMLYCNTATGKCDCDSTRFWDPNGNVCFLKRTYHENKCSNTSQCQEWRVLKCISNLCTCETDFFYEPSLDMCQYLHKENTTCLGTYQCFADMTCLGSQCKCGAFEYHDFSARLCTPQGSIGVSCSIDYNCRADKFLECQSGSCQCLVEYPHWSVGFDSCIVPVTYNGYCHDTTDCDTTKSLICKTSTNNCICPINVATSYCDCVRVSGDENYWNGSSCVAALAYNRSCINSAKTYMCQTMTQGTVCAGPAPFRCRCLSTQFFNILTSKCETKKSYNLLCLQADACRSDLGLSCVATSCQCNTAIKFWNGAICTNYYTYDDLTCTASGNECDASVGLVCRTNALTCNCPNAVTNACDCVTRVDGNEQYWNGTRCVFAGSYGKACLANYYCKTIEEKTVCSGGVCSCGSAGKWDPILEICKFCPSGWSGHRGSCFLKSDTKSDAWAASYCDNQGSSFMARLLNSDLSQFSWCQDCFISQVNIVGANYVGGNWGGAAASGPCYRIKDGLFENHRCHDGHYFLCEMPL